MVVNLKYRGRATQFLAAPGGDTPMRNGVTFALASFSDEKCTSLSHAKTRYEHLLLPRRPRTPGFMCLDERPRSFGSHRHSTQKSKAQARGFLPLTIQPDESMKDEGRAEGHWAGLHFTP